MFTDLCWSFIFCIAGAYLCWIWPGGIVRIDVRSYMDVNVLYYSRCYSCQMSGFG